MEELENECQKFYLDLISEKYSVGNKYEFGDNGHLKKKSLTELEIFVPPSVIESMKEKAKCNTKQEFIEMIDSILERTINKQFGYKELCMKVLKESIEKNGIFNKIPKQYTRRELVHILQKIYPNKNKKELNSKVDILFIASSNGGDLEKLVNEIIKNPKLRINDIAWRNCNAYEQKCWEDLQIEYFSRIKYDMAHILQIEKKYRGELFCILESMIYEISPIKYHPKFLNDTQEHIDIYNKLHPTILDKHKIKRIIEIKKQLNYTEYQLYNEILEDLKRCKPGYLLYDSKKIYDIIIEGIIKENIKNNKKGE